MRTAGMAWVDRVGAVLPEELIQYFVSDTSDSDWQVVGDKWFLYLVAVGLLCTLGMLGVKFLRKQSAPIHSPQLVAGRDPWLYLPWFLPLIALCFIGGRLLCLR